MAARLRCAPPRSTRQLLWISLAACIAAEPPWSRAGGTPVAATTPLVDQYGAASSVADQRGQVVVAIIVSARTLRQLRKWEEALRERHKSLRYARIADVDEKVQPSWAEVAATLRGRVPEGVAVSIDTARVWAGELALETRRPNLLLFGRDGALAARFRGSYTDQEFARVSAVVDSLLGRP